MLPKSSCNQIHVLQSMYLESDCLVGENKLFDQVAKELAEEMITVPPSNAFEEQIQWTKEGKLWTFPINNEQGNTNCYFIDINFQAPMPFCNKFFRFCAVKI